MDQDNVVILNTFNRECSHSKIIINESLSTVTCQLCDEKLNAVWILQQYAKAESRLKRRLAELRKLSALAEAKNRCKCRHCGSMTIIQRE